MVTNLTRWCDCGRNSSWFTFPPAAWQVEQKSLESWHDAHSVIFDEAAMPWVNLKFRSCTLVSAIP